MIVSQPWARSATTPVTHVPPSFHCITMSPFQTWNTMNGNVWTRARTNMAHATQLCQMLSFSWEIPVRAETGFALAPRTLEGWPDVNAIHVNKVLEYSITYNRNGMQARAMYPARVAMGGELPKLSFRVLGQ